MCISYDNTQRLQRIAVNRDYWSADAEEHYRELADQLRGVAAKCRLPNPQRELLNLAQRYERRAEYFAEWAPFQQSCHQPPFEGQERA